MAQRLRVLISAYACEPGKGSEPEVGWQWALQMARFHDVTVLTRRNNRENIERGLRDLPAGTPIPSFVYHEEPNWIVTLKRILNTQLYYALWQDSARHVIATLHRERPFDLLHHVTFAAYRYTTAIWGHGVPCIWGPVGGMESIPARLLPWKHPATLFYEVLRNLNNFVQSMPFHVLPRRARESSAILVSTRETEKAFTQLGIESILMPTVGISEEIISTHEIGIPQGPLELLFVGQIIALKGIELALHGLKESQTDARLTFVGDGRYRCAAEKLAARLGLAGQVRFLGKVPRAEVLDVYSRFHVFIFPSLHDSGGFAVLEAMAKGLPVICLDCGGPALSVCDGCGVKIPVTERPQVITGISAAIEFYHLNRLEVRNHGTTARETVRRNYEWNTKGEEMNLLYEQVGRKHAVAPPSVHDADPSIEKPGGASNLWTTLRRTKKALNAPIRVPVFPYLKGLIATIVFLMCIAGVEFGAMEQLKQAAKSITYDTLPGLSYAGAANETRNQSFIRTLLVVTNARPEDNENYLREITHLSEVNDTYLKQYQAAIFDPNDRLLFAQLIKARQDYFAIRGVSLQLIRENRQPEALALMPSLLPAYEAYAKEGQNLMRRNIEVGKIRSQKIMQVYYFTQLILITIAIVIFVGGFMLGFLKR